MEEKNYYKVPSYIEKAIKKLFKTKDTEKELISQINDYMMHHNIPSSTPLTLLKNFPDEEVHPNQVSLNLEESKEK